MASLCPRCGHEWRDSRKALEAAGLRLLLRARQAKAQQMRWASEELRCARAEHARLLVLSDRAHSREAQTTDGPRSPPASPLSCATPARYAACEEERFTEASPSRTEAWRTPDRRHRGTDDDALPRYADSTPPRPASQTRACQTDHRDAAAAPVAASGASSLRRRLRGVALAAAAVWLLTAGGGLWYTHDAHPAPRPRADQSNHDRTRPEL
mmetsp:Transcript_6590/g.23539  ORF Transcript_6590/g.23539 Transcript_6590/m.23539 type:complete len:211 (+) Transcript_6590:192-824(+)